MKLFDLPRDPLALVAANLTIRQELALRRMCRGVRNQITVAVRLARALFGLPQSPSSISEPSMKLFDLPYDALALIVAKLSVKQQQALRGVCREARDLTAGAAMAVRLAHALFRIPQSPSSVLAYPAYSQGVRVYPFFPGLSGGVWLHLQNNSDASDGGFARARISCRGFEHSTGLAVEVDMVSGSFIRLPVSRETAERFCAERGLSPESWEQWREHLEEDGYEGKWQEDKVGLRFEVSAEGNVGAVSVAFHQGLSKRRAWLVGKVLGEVLKGVNASKASLLTQCFAECEDPGKAGILSQASAKCEDASKKVQTKPSGEGREVFFEENRVRVITRPHPGPQNLQVHLTVL